MNINYRVSFFMRIYIFKTTLFHHIIDKSILAYSHVRLLPNQVAGFYFFIFRFKFFKYSFNLFYYYYNSSAVMLVKKHYSMLKVASSLCGLSFISLVRSFPSLKNFGWALKGIVHGLTVK